MGYRINYESPVLHTKRKILCRNINILKIISISVIGFIVLFALSDTKLRRLILPGDPVVTERALSELVVDIRQGQPVSDAITAFCGEILDNA